jgi:hypothetical protein
MRRYLGARRHKGEFSRQYYFHYCELFTFILHNVIKIMAIKRRIHVRNYLLAVIFSIVLNYCLYFKINVEVNDESSTSPGGDGIL